MAMQFWQAKRQRRFRTLLSLIVFTILACIVSYLFDLFLRFMAQEGYLPPLPYAGLFLLAFIVLVATGYYTTYALVGGKVAPESMGGWQVDPYDQRYPKEVQLFHIVEEMAIASRMPVPEVYVIEAYEINAFAAGLKANKSIIAVTTGALDQLTRDELQGVVAHEFGHIANGDMRMGMQLAALVMGFFVIFYIGLRLMESSFFFGRGSNGERRGNATMLIALSLLIAGLVLWLTGTLLRACVSRQREYLADASAVEYTRHPEGIIGALKKIKLINEEGHDLPKSGLGYAHMYFDCRSFWCRLFATHPPLDKRIKALKGKDL